MPIVFVHGVDTTKGPDYERQVQARNALFQQFLGVSSDSIRNPYWGDLGGKLAFGLKCLPIQAENFGAQGHPLLSLLAELNSTGLETDSEHILLSIARISLIDAVDALWGAMSLLAEEEPLRAAAAAKRALDYAGHQASSPPWLNLCRNDSDFVERLLRAIDQHHATSNGLTAPSVESFGAMECFQSASLALSALRESADACIRDQVGASWESICNAARPLGMRKTSRFLGDALVYLNARGDRGSEGDIVQAIRTELVSASEMKTNEDPLVVVGHSMGGNICYDLLTHFLAESIECDIFVTVGTQVGLFEELKLFKTSSAEIPSVDKDRVPLAKSIKRWINVYDPIDILAYSACRIFEGVEDYQFRGRALNPISAHSMYFSRPSFYERLQHHIENPRR